MKEPAGNLEIEDNLANSTEEASPSLRRSKFGGRFWLFLGYIAILTVAFVGPLVSWAYFAKGSDVHSYVLLIPFVTAYLIYIHWRQLSGEYTSSPLLAVVPLLGGVIALAASWRFRADLGENDYLTLVTAGFVCFVIGGAFAILGGHWVRSAAFPLAFLLFMIPLPEGVVDFLEIASQNASAEVASILFLITGTPTLRDGNLFQLPGIMIRVAQECSGIRSTLVLIITSLLACHLFLRSAGRRAALLASVIPLGLLRNGFRILVISLLCVHFGPHMIESPIHRRGGPIFFALSMIPLLLLLWALYRNEQAEAVNKRPMGAT